MKTAMIVCVGLVIGPLGILSANISSAFAASKNSSEPSEYKKFETAVAKFVRACPQFDCQNNFKAKKIFSRVEKIALEKDLHKALKKVAHDQAQIWGDTILEGDYYAAGNTRLDQVLALYEQDALIGFRIGYSEKAWDTSECAFSEEDKASLKECTQGRISESSFVSANFDIAITDENQFAEFQPNE